MINYLAGYPEYKEDSLINPEGALINYRNDLLLASDWTQGVDAPLSDAEKAAYATYRQELRDLPAQEGFPYVDIPQYVAPE